MSSKCAFNMARSSALLNGGGDEPHRDRLVQALDDEQVAAGRIAHVARMEMRRQVIAWNIATTIPKTRPCLEMSNVLDTPGGPD
jgi:hypothetical protein